MGTKYPGNIVTSGASAGYSVAFDGTGDSLTLADNTAFEFGSGNFTVEAWVYVTATPGASGASIVTKSSATYPGGYEFNFVVQNDRKVFFGFYTTTQVDLLGTTAISLNTWNHIAVSRSGSNFALFVNGTREATNTGGGTIQATSSSLYIGDYGGGSRTLTGNISNLRIVKGSAVYDPTQTTILVPTQLFAITNTSLLTCNSPAIVDQSSNAFAITANGDAKVSTFTPFPGYQAYNPALGASTPGIWSVSDAIQARQTRRWNMYDPTFQNTTLLLHGNGTNGAQNNTFLDSSSNNFTITRNGNTTQGTFSPFSQASGYWSNYFNGSTDALAFAGTTQFQFGTGDFTCEAFVYILGTSGDQYIVGTYDGANGGFAFWVDSSSTGLGFRNGDVGLTTRSFAFAIGRWYHVAVTRSSSTLRFFVNGVQVGADATGYTQNITRNNTNGCSVGRYFLSSNSAGGYFTGYLSNVRVVNGTAVYTTSYTVPTSPLTAVTNTQLLTCQSNYFVDTNTQVAAKTITTYGTTSVQAFSPFYPVVAYTPSTIGGSEYQASGSNALTTAYNAAFSFGSGDFTIQFWAYPTAAFTANDHALVSIGENVGTNKNLLFSGYTGSSGTAIRLALSSNGSTFDLVASQDCGTITLNAWNHYGIVRSGTTVTVYKNGTSVGSFAVSTSSLSSQTAYGVTIANYRNSGALTSNSFPGYIAGLQILKGTAINFASTGVPTAPPTAITNTSLLCNFTNGAIADSTGKNVLETVGNAQISTTQSKFGGSSMYFDGTGDYIAMPATKPLLFGTAPFTVEGWIYLTSTGIEQFIYSFSYTSSNFQFYVTTANKLRYTRGATILITGTSTLSANTWYHVALVRTGTGTNGLTIYLNGTSEGSATEATDFGGTGTVNVGQFVGGGDYELNGYIDDFRVTTGYARYTANFTPQTSQWQDQ
jgi:hypothetical protein